MSIGFSDDSLAGIIANILADISTIWFDYILIYVYTFNWFNWAKNIYNEKWGPVKKIHLFCINKNIFNYWEMET